MNIINKYECYTNIEKKGKNKDYFSKESIQSNKFIVELLKISKNRCYICGMTFETNHTKGIYFEREHIINQSITQKSTQKCKKNIIPICRICNSKKTHVEKDSVLEENLQRLHTSCIEEGIDSNDCDYDRAFKIFRNQNFDFRICARGFSEEDKVVFDIISKTFVGSEISEKYIEKFDLNNRNEIIFLNIFKILYRTNFSGYPSLKDHLFQFSMSSLDDEFINYLDEIDILNCNIGESLKRDNLIELITLMENIYY